MLRLIRADLLKLERRRGMLALVAGLLFVAVGAYFGVGAILDKTTDFDSASGILTLLASVAGAIIGATAGGADIETGVFRDLVATGRSRTALFFARVPAAWAIVLGLLIAALILAAVIARPALSQFAEAAAQVVASGALTAAVCVGLAAMTGRSGPVMGLALAFQLGVAPLLAQIEALGDARLAIPAVAISRLGGADGFVAALPLLGAIGIILAWAAAGLAGGLYRTRTAEI
jgi:hypothetical protein